MLEKIGRDFLIGLVLFLIAVGIGYAIGKVPSACSATVAPLPVQSKGKL